ncbi:MAG TPA: tyrosine--tRNA ligase, partial [Candidatus Limnocylindrales bacterium]|nr:tyrosine--tRNA ligase [Candidatus Limnocylindrales bacterium]
IQTRLGEGGAGISYAEFSYVLIQGYDFLHLFREHGVTLQLCGSDQWGNSIAGVELIRRVAGGEAHVWSTPLIINRATGKKFGKSEEGAVWLDPAQTTPTQFYQFWINVDDEGVEDYLKVYTELAKAEIDAIMEAHTAHRADRQAQKHLAREVTRLVHGDDEMMFAEVVTEYLTGARSVADADETILRELRQQIPTISAAADGSIVQALVETGLVTSNTEARRLLANNAIAINGAKVNREQFEPEDFAHGRLMLKKGKKFKDSALVELG